jgi:hypothetical protein
MTRRAISPPTPHVGLGVSDLPGPITVPKIVTNRVPADMTQTVRPGKRVVLRQELEAARQALVTHAALMRDALRDLDCHPRELTGVLAAIDHVLDDDFRSPETRGGS